MIKISRIAPFQSAIRAISNFISEGNFRFNEKGLFFRAIDPSQIVLVNYHAANDFFDEFDIEPNLIGLDIDELNKVIRRASSNDQLEMELEDSFLRITLRGSLTRNFMLPLIDVLEEEPEIPEQDYDANIEIEARVLQEALKDASLFGSSVVFRIEGSKLFIEARGSEGTLKTEASQSELVKIKAKDNVVSKYSLNFLENIVKEAEPGERILLELKSEAPMRITYNIGPAKIQFHLAHMIL